MKIIREIIAENYFGYMLTRAYESDIILFMRSVADKNEHNVAAGKLGAFVRY